LASASAAISARLASAGTTSGRALGRRPRWLVGVIGLVVSSVLLIGLVVLLMPKPAAPPVPLPAIPAPSAVALPQTDSGSAPSAPPVARSPEPPRGPQTFRRRVLLHVHEWSLSWRLGPALLLALALGGLFGARRLRESHHVPHGSTAGALATVAITIAAWPAAITVPDSTGQPIRDGKTSVAVKQFDNGDREIVTTVEKRHRHLPIEIAFGWILVGGIGSAMFGQDLAAASRRRTQARLRRPTAASGPVLHS